METQNYFRDYLREELLKRCKKNPSYSLRAFAKSLDMDFSALAKMLAGKRTIGPKVMKRLGLKIGLKGEEINHFISEDKPLSKFQSVELDVFESISNWYHYAILELIKTEHFKADVKWIAKRLTCTPLEIETAVQRLQRLQLLEIKNGTWICKKNNTTTDHPFTTQAFRNLQKQILQKAIDALEDVPIQQRDQSSMTMAIDTARLPEAKERIKKFRRDMNKFLSPATTKNEVYNLSISLYPITKDET